MMKLWRGWRSGLARSKLVRRLKWRPKWGRLHLKQVQRAVKLIAASIAAGANLTAGGKAERHRLLF